MKLVDDANSIRARLARVLQFPTIRSVSIIRWEWCQWHHHDYFQEVGRCSIWSQHFKYNKSSGFMWLFLRITTLNIELGIIIKSQDESLNKSRIAKFNDQLYCSKGDQSFQSTLWSNLCCDQISVRFADNWFTTVYWKSLSLWNSLHLTGIIPVERKVTSIMLETKCISESNKMLMTV